VSGCRSAPFATIAFPLSLPSPLTYAVPPELQSRIAVGMRALAPVQNRLRMGYVVQLSEETDLKSVKSIVDLPDEEPIFTEEVLHLCTWMSEYYCCSLGEALHAAAPPGARMHAQRRFMLHPEGLTSARFTEKQKAIVEALYRAGTLTERDLCRVVGVKDLSRELTTLLKRNVIVEAPSLVEQQVSEKLELFVCLEEDRILEEESLLELQRRAPRQAAVYLDLLHGEPERMAPILYEKHSVSLEVLRALERKGLVRLEHRESYRLPEFAVDEKTRVKPALNEEQEAAWREIVEAVDAGSFRTFLLQGITGSGKTEVYLQAVEYVLSLGKNAIILVPEISLTPQTVARFKARFDTDIAVLHSGLSPGERYDEWRRAWRGEVRIVVGARSAIFAPVANLGLLVVDEEHDLSYKQADPAPRYHARDVAVMRAKLAQAVCVLGSATPSLESSYNAERGKFGQLMLTRRALSAALPRVEIVDMRAETREVGSAPFFSRRLEEAIRQRMDVEEQVLLLLNRRGFAPFVLCPMCGWSATCVDCHVSMTYHAKGAALVCHYCNRRTDVPQVCGECGFQTLLFLGQGTQKVEETLRHMFPDRRVERMDADTTSGKGGHAKILGRLAAREIDILVGTQMIAKGHDYPYVTLVGVLNADSGLGFPDFRASEQTFQLLTQVGGRSGRGDLPGEVIIQTYRPKHYAICCAATHDYQSFYEQEIVNRQGAGYPPFRRMANVLLESEDPVRAERAAATAQKIARAYRKESGYTHTAILGPAPGLVPRVRKKYRWNVGFLSPHAKWLHALVRAVVESLRRGPGASGVDIKVDLDPYGIL